MDGKIIINIIIFFPFLQGS